MKKFLICLVFILMAGVGYGFSSETVPRIDQDESLELSVDNTVSQNVNYVVGEIPALESVSFGEDMGQSFEIHSIKVLLMAKPLVSNTVLEPDLFKNENLYNLTLATLENSQSTKSGVYRRARDGLQNG